jgi:hypothetical protein
MSNLVDISTLSDELQMQIAIERSRLQYESEAIARTLRKSELETSALEFTTDESDDYELQEAIALLQRLRAGKRKKLSNPKIEETIPEFERLQIEQAIKLSIGSSSHSHVTSSSESHATSSSHVPSSHATSSSYVPGSSHVPSSHATSSSYVPSSSYSRAIISSCSRVPISDDDFDEKYFRNVCSLITDNYSVVSDGMKKLFDSVYETLAIDYKVRCEYANYLSSLLFAGHKTFKLIKIMEDECDRLGINADAKMEVKRLLVYSNVI